MSMAPDFTRGLSQAEARERLLRDGPNEPSSTGRRNIGSAGPTIAKLAEQQKFDFIVPGTHGHGSVAGLVIGSVAMAVVSLCGTPVLLVR